MAFTVSYKIKDTFFDRPKVQAAMKERGEDVLYRIAHFIRQEARRGQKLRGFARKPPKKMTGKVMERRQKESQLRKPSPAGSPPYAWTDHPVATLRNILYGYDSARHSVIVGPVGLNQKQYLNGKFRSGTVPELHEFGGTAGIREKQSYAGSWVPMGRRKARPGQATRVRLARYPARPFMAPALAKARTRFGAVAGSKQKINWYSNLNAA